MSRLILSLIPMILGLPGPLAASPSLPVLNEVQELFASDAQSGDQFGYPLAIEGGRLVTGARMDDDLGEGAGSAYVFERNEEGEWLETAKLTASDGDIEDRFGWVALSGDTIVVGAEFEDEGGLQAGAAYVFELDEGGEWVETAKLMASDGRDGDTFGEAAVRGDTVIVGADEHDTPTGESTGAVWVFERTESGSWVETAKLTASDAAPVDRFGSAVAIDRETIVVGARSADPLGASSGAAYVFERGEDGSWAETAKLLASDGASGDTFGGLLAIDGDTIAVGAVGRDDQGLSSGAAYVFERGGNGIWVETAKLLAPEGRAFDSFGRVALDGDLLAVGADGGESLPGVDSGTVDLYVRDAVGWSHTSRLLPSEGRNLDLFGIRVGIDGDTVVVGARMDDSRGLDAGSVYVFELEECVLDVRLDPAAVLPGEELRIGIRLEHRRPETVTVPFRIWIEDAEGGLVASRTTEPQTFHHGDAVRRELTIRIPEGTPAGEYRVLVGAERMQQGLAGAERSFTVLGPAPPTLVRPSR